MADSVIKRQVELEQNLIKKARSNCPNTSLDLSIVSPMDKFSHDDSGYTGLDSTPRRPYRRIHQKRIGFQPEQNDTFDFPQQSLVQIIHYIVIILVAHYVFLWSQIRHQRKFNFFSQRRIVLNSISF